MIKPDFESATVLSTFIDVDLPEALHRLADFIKANPIVKDYDSAMRINASYGDEEQSWYVSFMTAYSIDKKIIKSIRKK